MCSPIEILRSELIKLEKALDGAKKEEIHKRVMVGKGEQSIKEQKFIVFVSC